MRIGNIILARAHMSTDQAKAKKPAPTIVPSLAFKTLHEEIR